MCVALGVLAGLLTPARAQFTYTEDFKNNTAAGWVLNPAGNSDIGPVLTGGTAPRSGDPEMGDTYIDPAGSGWLRLTNETTNLHNAVYFDTPIPSAGNSVTINFGMNLWGGNNYNNTGADGFTFFLYDASKEFEVGARGGALGYAQMDAVNSTILHDGLNGGWVGVAFDPYGNFSTNTEGKEGGLANLNPNSVAVRGPGQGQNNYDYLAGTGDRDYTDTGGATTLDAGDGTIPDLPYTLAFPTASERPNQSTQYRNVSITFDENSQLSVSIQFGEDGLWYDIIDVDLSSFVRPEQLKMGFAAGTGGGTMVTEIGGLLSVTATAGSGNFVWDNGEGASFKIWGTGADDPLNWAGNTNPTLKSNVIFNSTYITGAQSIDVTGSDKVVKNIYFSGPDAYTLTTSDQRKLIFDSDSNGVPTSINVTSDAGGNTSHTIALDVLMNKNLEVNNNIANLFTISGNVDTNGNTLTSKGVGATAFTGVISGSGGLVKSDSGTTTLSGASANTYTGTTVINGGTLQIEKAGALGSTAAGTTVNSGGTLALGGSGLTFAAEGLTLNGTGVGNNGALLNAAGNNTWAGTVALASDSHVGVATGTTLTVSGVVSGAAGNDLTKVGAGTLVLSGTNTYTGATNIAAGTLAISSEANLGANPGSFNAAQLNLDGGTLRTQTNAVTIDDANRGVTLGTAGGTFETQTDLTIATAVAGSGTLTKTGTGTLTLSGTNSHSGAVTISAGTLTATGGSAIGDTSAVSIAGGATFNTAGSSETVGSIAGAGNIALGTGTTNLTVGGNDTSTAFSGVISGGANANLVKTGSGTLTMSGTNTFDGNLQINQGTVALGASNVFDNDTSLVLNGGTFATHSGGTGHNETFNDLSLLANSAIDYGSLAGELTFGNAARTAGTLTIYGWAGDISGGGASQLLFSNAPTGFTGNLDQIVFDGYGAGAVRLASGEIVPVTGTVFTWNSAGSTWATNGNWDSTPDGFPGGTGHTAIFGSAITSNLSLSLAANRTLGYLVFNDDNNVTLQNNTLTFDVASGAAQLNVNSTGSATISSAVRFADNASINQNSTGTLTISGAVTSSTSGTKTLTIGGSGDTLISGEINPGSGNISLVKTGTGTLTLSAADNDYTGKTIINQGVLAISSEAQLGNNPGSSVSDQLTLNGGTLRTQTSAVTIDDANREIFIGANGGTFDTVTDLTVASTNVMSGSGTLTKTGSGVLRLQAANTHTGNIVVNAGTLRTSGGSSLGNDATVTVNGGSSIWQTESSETVGLIAGDGQIVFGATSTLTVGTAGNSTFTGTITDGTFTGALTKQGTGILTLGGPNTYDGATAINVGTLNIQHNTALGSTTGGTTVAGGAALELQHGTGLTIGNEALTLSGTGVSGNGALRSVAGANSLSGDITLAGQSEIQTESGSSLTLSGDITSGSTQNLAVDGGGDTTLSGSIASSVGTLEKSGTGTLTLSNANAYTGATTINTGGTVAISHGSALGSAAAGTTVSSGATLALSNNITVAENLTTSGQGVGNLGALRNTAGNNTLTGTITLASETYVGVESGTTLTATGAIGGTAGLSKQGAGTLVLDSATANDYDGTTAIAAGTLEVRRSTSLGDVNATTIAEGATLKLNGSGLSLDENITVTGAGVSGAGAIQNTGGNNTLTGVITMTGNSTVSATTGTTLTLTDGSLAGDFNLVKTGAGGLTMGNTANTYTGTTTIRDGTLTVTADAPNSSAGALGNAGSAIQVGDSSTGGGANLALLTGGSGGVDIGRQVAVNNQGASATLGGTNTTGTNTFAGNVTLARDTNLTAATGGTVAFSGTVAGSGAVTKTGDGTVVLSGTNTYAGATTVSAGTLQVANASALGSTAAGTTVSNGATLALSGGITLASGESLSLTGAGVSAATGALNNVSGDNTVAGAVTFAGNTTIGSTAGTLTVSGAIGESGGSRNLITEGAGNITFSGAGSFTGSVTVDGTGTVTLASSGQAFGSVSGITINSGATLALGASNQINDSANLTLAGGVFSAGGFSETMRQLTQTQASTIDYLNDGGVLNFNGGGSVNGLGTLTGTLTISNWAGSLDGSGGEQLVVYSTGGAPVVTGITFTDWGTATTVARGDLGSGYYEIVPTLTGNEWNNDSATTQFWGTGTNWSSGSVPNADNAIAILGNTVGSPPLDNNITISMQTTNRKVGKLIFENSADRSYTVGVGTSGRLDFNVTSGQGQIIVNDDGAHTIAANSRYNDNMLVTNNSDAATGLTISGNIELRDAVSGSGGTNLTTFNGDGRTIVSGTISQNATTGSILKTGSGTLVLSGTNSYTGTTTLRNGTLELAGNAPSGSSGNLGNATSSVVINDASTTGGMNTSLLMTDADGGSTVGRALAVGNYGATTTLGGTNTSGTNTFSGAVTLDKDVDLTAATGGTVAFSGALSGNGGIEKVGGGTVTLSGTGANTFAGDVTVTAGTLTVNKTGAANLAIHDNADVTVASGASLVFAGGQNETIGSLAGAGSLNNSGTAVTLTTGGNGASTTFSGNITDSGSNLSLVKTGSGTMTLSGAGSDYAGTTTVSAGTLVAASNNALGSSTGGTTVNQDATLGLQGGITITDESLNLAAKAAANLASLANLAGNNTFTGNISLTGGNAGDDVKIDAATGTQLTLDGNITEATNTKDITKSGGGTVVLTGANTYTGDTSVAAGTLVVGNSDALGSTAGNTFVQVGATLAFDHTTGVTLGSGEDLTLYATASPTAPGLKNIAGSNTVQGNVAMSGGVNTGVIIDTNAGTLNLAGVVSNGVNANFITKTGAGTLTLSGNSANTYGGATNVNNGTLLLSKTAGLNAVGPGNLNIGDSIGAAASATVQLAASNQINNATAVTIATDGKLDLQGNSDAIGALTMAGGSVTATGGGTLTLGGNLTFNGIGTSTAAITANVDLGGNRIVQVGNNAVSTAADRDLTINGVVSGTGSSFTKTDLGTLELTGAANTFTGDFQITDGKVVLNKTAVAGVKGNATGVGNANVTIGDSVRAANTAIMEVSGDGLASGQTSDQIANTATLTVNSDGKFLLSRTSGTDDFTETIGALAGSGNVDLGYYSLIAGGNNASTTFSGTLAGQSAALFTKAGTGTLTIDSNLGFGGDLDLSAGTLAFNVDNAFNGAVNIFAGSTLKLSDADLTIANLNFVGSGTITLDFSGASQLNVTNLTIAAGITVNVINWTDATDYFFAQNWAGAVFNTHDVTPVNQVVFADFGPADTVWLGYDNQITPVPEPSTYGAMLIGALGALLGFRRWRNAKRANTAAAKK